MGLGIGTDVFIGPMGLGNVPMVALVLGDQVLGMMFSLVLWG